MKKILILLLIFFSFSFAVDKGIPITILFEGLKDLSNDELSSGTVTFYTAGTTTKKDVYTTVGKGTAASNPYTLDSNGRAQLWANDDAFYKLLIKDSDGVTVDTWDNQFFGTALNDIDNRKTGATTAQLGTYTDLTIKNDSFSKGLSWDNSTGTELWSIKNETTGLEIDKASTTIVTITANGMTVATFNVSGTFSLSGDFSASNLTATTGTINNFVTTTSNIGLFSSSTQPFCDTFTATARNIPNTTATAITLNNELTDTDSMHDNSTNSSRITINKAGKYIISGYIVFADNATGYRQVDFSENGSGNFFYTLLKPFDGTATSVALTAIRDFSAADYVEMRATQTSGGALSITSAHFSAAKLY